MNLLNISLCENINNFRLTMLLMGHATVDKSWTGEIYSPAFSRLYYISGGEALISTENGDFPLISGRWYLLPAGCSFKYSCKKSMEHLFFHIKLSGPDGLDTLKCCHNPIYMESDYKDIFHLSVDSGILDGLMIHSSVYSVLTTLLKKNDISLASNSFSPCVTKAIKYINKNLSAQLTTEDIAAHTFVSKSTVTKSFKKELGMSVQEYLYDIIMFEAVQLLTHNLLSIADISEKLGFSDQFYFSRRFHQKFGVSPREYRKNVLL